MHEYTLDHLSDAVLLRDLAALVASDRVASATLLAHIAEVDARRLCVSEGYPSMFVYCTDELRLSEDSAYKRIRAARAARRFPVLFTAVAEGRLHLAAVCLISPHLTDENVQELIEEATHRRKCEIEVWLARRFPVPEPPAIGPFIRPIPFGARQPAESSSSEGQLALVPIGDTSNQDELAPGPATSVPDRNELALGPATTPGSNRDELALGPATSNPGRKELAPGPATPGPIISAERRHAGPADPGIETAAPEARARFLVRLAIDAATHDKLRRAQALLSHTVPARDVAQVLDRALDALLAELENRKLGASPIQRPRSRHPTRPPRRRRRRRTTNGSRYIAASIRRAVWERDQGQCTFVGTSGHRCGEKSFLEFDHVEPVARGGRAMVDGLRLRCRAHNQYEAECMFGADFMRRKRKEARLSGPQAGPAEARPDRADPRPERSNETEARHDTANDI